MASVPLSHLSIELGHLYMDDFVAGPGLQQHFEQVAPWANAGSQACADSLQSYQGRRVQQGREARARISTCFLVDDYFTRFSSPAELVPELVRAARAAGLEIDYLARESGCAVADDVPLARSVEGLLVADPSPHTNGSRPPAAKVGWLCNGQRSPANDAVEAMETVRPWTPPVQNGARRHSIFLDVQLWDENHGKKRGRARFWRQSGSCFGSGCSVTTVKLWRRHENGKVNFPTTGMNSQL